MKFRIGNYIRLDFNRHQTILYRLPTPASGRQSETSALPERVTNMLSTLQTGLLNYVEKSNSNGIIHIQLEMLKDSIIPIKRSPRRIILLIALCSNQVYSHHYNTVYFIVYNSQSIDHHLNINYKRSMQFSSSKKYNKFKYRTRN